MNLISKVLNALSGRLGTNSDKPAPEKASEWVPPGHNYKNEGYDVVVVIAFQHRQKVVAFLVDKLLEANLPDFSLGVVLACSEDEDSQFVDGLQQKYSRIGKVLCKNNPLGNKWQLAVDFARSLKPKCIMITGSDDYIAPEYILEQCKFLQAPENKDIAMVGVRNWLAVARDYSDEMKVWELAYGENALPYPLGAGRVYDARFLDHVDWQIFDRYLNKSLDRFGYKQVIDKKWTVHMPKVTGPAVVSIKGEWDMMNSLESFYTNQSIELRKVDFESYGDSISVFKEVL